MNAPIRDTSTPADETRTSTACGSPETLEAIRARTRLLRSVHVAAVYLELDDDAATVCLSCARHVDPRDVEVHAALGDTDVSQFPTGTCCQWCATVFREATGASVCGPAYCPDCGNLLTVQGLCQARCGWRDGSSGCAPPK
ncbi:MAG: hypothetical protein ACRDXX_15170 [Stackebrandtia sp.]